MSRKQELKVIIESLRKDIFDLGLGFDSKRLSISDVEKKAKEMVELNNQLLKYIKEYDSL